MDMTRLKWWVLFLLGLSPTFWLIVKIATDQLGSNPIQAIHFYLGIWTLRFLCLSLAITPLRKITNWKWPLTYRRMIGLFTFYYASVHLLNYLITDQVLVWGNIKPDLLESPYIIMGVLTYLFLLLLAITSTIAWQKRLGHYWKKLHRLVYIAAVTALLHYFWHLKGNLAQPLFYAAIVSLLLGFRLIVKWQNLRRSL